MQIRDQQSHTARRASAGSAVNARVRTTALLAGIGLVVIGTQAVSAAASQGTNSCGSIYNQLDRDMHTAYDRAVSDSAFTGIALRGACGPIDVYLSSLSPAAPLSTIGALSPTEFSFHQVRASLGTLLSIQDRITSNLDVLKQTGLAVYAYWPDMTTGLETLQVAAATPYQQELVVRLFGPDTVLRVVPNPVPLRLLADRANEAPPFNGGDFIENLKASFLIDCTGGVGAHQVTSVNGVNYTTFYMVTNGHCSVDASGNPGVTGNYFRNAYDDNGTITGSQAPIGQVTANYGIRTWTSPQFLLPTASPASLAPRRAQVTTDGMAVPLVLA